MNIITYIRQIQPGCLSLMAGNFYFKTGMDRERLSDIHVNPSMGLALASMRMTISDSRSRSMPPRSCLSFKAGMRVFCFLLMTCFVFPVVASDFSELKKKLAVSEQSGNERETVALLIQLSDALVDLGEYQESTLYLERALKPGRKIKDEEIHANILGRLADNHIVTGETDQAASLLYEALALLEKQESSQVRSKILIDLGNLYVAKDKLALALGAYKRALNEAIAVDNDSLTANALTNIARIKTGNSSFPEAYSALTAAVDETNKLPDNYDKAFLQISLAQLARQIKPEQQELQEKLVLLEYQLLEQAAAIADSISSARLASYAYGYMGTLYAREKRYNEAEHFLRKAIYKAYGSDKLYLWQWELGKVNVQTGRREAAIQNYRDAVASLQTVRTKLATGLHRKQGPFRETTGALYYELADLLLQKPDAASAASVAQLYEARQTVELLKAVELEDYFNDSCVTALASRTSGVDNIEPQTAILYIIELKDRLELLVSLPEGIRQVTVAVTGDDLHEEIQQFRHYLEKRTTRQYMRQAIQLYDWMIRPIESILEENNITTLVTVPQGSMTTIPFAALHDGKQYLVEKFALATTPGLKLTAPGMVDKAKADVLLAGLSESVQGFTPLPNVPDELGTVEDIFGGVLLENQEFSYTNMNGALERKPYPLIHMATHAQFKGRSNDTFLLMWDERMNLDELQRLIGLGEFRKQPVELLVLSACQTAVGDEQAALGLAGVAVKAGARSALASLWFVNDESTSLMVAEFYKHYKKPGVSKSRALRAAQLEMIRDLRYRHPGYWAPFLLIGNWL